MRHKIFSFKDNKSRWWLLAVIPILLMTVAIGLYLLNSRDKALSPIEQTTETTKTEDDTRIRFHETNVGAKVSLDQKASSAEKAENTDEVFQTAEETQKPTGQLPEVVVQSSEMNHSVESQNLAGDKTTMSDAEKAALEMERQQLLRELAELGADEPEKQARFATYPIEVLRQGVRDLREIQREHEAMFQRKHWALYEWLLEIQKEGRKPTPQDYEEFNRYWKSLHGY